MITLKQITKRYHGQVALDGVNLTLPQGKMAFLTGHSGAGKSTVLRLIMMLEPPTSGQIMIHDKDISHFNRRQVAWYRQTIGAVFQNHQLLNHCTLYDNVALPLKISGYHPNTIKPRVAAALRKVSLVDKADHLPETLSAGEKQRIGIARAIINKPRIILADEPTGNLDPQLAKETMQLFEQFSQAGISVLIASHDLNLINTMPYPKIELHQGRVVGLTQGNSRHGHS